MRFDFHKYYCYLKFFYLIFIIAKPISGLDELKTVFQFDQLLLSNSTNDHGFNITIPEGHTFSKGFTLCLRALFKVWNERCIFYTDGLTMRLKDYTREIGGLNMDEKYYFFKWSDKLLISSNPWSTICLAFNSTDSIAKLVINGKGPFK
jgi:hypothetical protein